VFTKSIFPGGFFVTKVIGFRVNEDQEKVVKELKQALIREYGSHHRFFAQELIKAIEKHLATSDLSHAHTKPAKISTAVKRMVAMFYDLPNDALFTYDYLDKVIGKHAGVDPRTLRSYRKQLYAWGLIEPRGGSWVRGHEKDWVKEVDDLE
jgi:hypothetical protein